MQPYHLKAILLGVIVALGTFARVTFAVFSFPFLLSFLFMHKPSAHALVLRALSLGCAFVSTCTANVILDSWYFGQTVFTPLNFVRYNSDPANLAQHGIHPRWLHAAVNLPLLLGPLFVIVLIAIWNLAFSTRTTEELSKSKLAQHNESPVRTRALTRACCVSGLGALAVLSAVPHQEPRFLLPILPLVVLGLPRIPRSRIFVYAWVGFNVLLTIVYGVLHQGGIVPTATWIEGHLKSQHVSRKNITRIDADVLYWRTYSVPRVLFGVSETSMFIVDVLFLALTILL
jgi:phosphatidylinositol glycan class Z